MKDSRIEYFDANLRIGAVIVDASSAATALAGAHLSGPTAAGVLGSALAGAALLGSEMDLVDETVTWRLDCDGPIGGFLVECTAAGTLRGYTKRKILSDFDGVRVPGAGELFGESGRFEVIRSVPGKILASGSVEVSPVSFSGGLDGYFNKSLQRRVVTAVAGASGDDPAEGVLSRALMVECAPDGDVDAFAEIAANFSGGTIEEALKSPATGARTLLGKIGLRGAEKRRESEIKFECRCSPDRAKAVLAALQPDERESLPPEIDVTCHMCGRTWTVKTK